MDAERVIGLVVYFGYAGLVAGNKMCITISEYFR